MQEGSCWSGASCTSIATTFTNDAANRIITATNGLTTTSFACNSQGDRVNQDVAGVTTTYTLDLAAKTNSYLCGNGRLAGFSGANAEYILSDGLGSVRPLADCSGAVALSPLTPEQSIPTLSLWNTPQSPQPPAVRIPCAPAWKG
jgi:YD repeat-containing protein